MTDSGALSRRDLLLMFRRECGLTDLPVERLELALTHRSAAYEQSLAEDNERLEFLGDSVLGAITSEELYRRFNRESEGDLSKRRAHLVSRAQLGRRAEALGLGPLLVLGVGERKCGGARRRSILGGALEAVVGEIHLSLGFEAARRFALRHVIEPQLVAGAGKPFHGDFKSALQERTQKADGAVPEYRVLEQSGPDHARHFVVEVLIGGRSVGRGEGGRIKTAETAAARAALEALDAEES